MERGKYLARRHEGKTGVNECIIFITFMVKRISLWLMTVQNEESPLCGSGKREKGPSGKYETEKYL